MSRASYSSPRNRVTTRSEQPAPTDRRYPSVLGSALAVARQGWRIGPGAHYTPLTPHHRVLAQSALAFQGFGHRPLENLRDHSFVLVLLCHERLDLCSNRIVPGGCINSVSRWT